MRDSRLVILPATSLIGPLKQHVTGMGFWLDDSDMRLTIAWIISQHVSEMGLIQLPVGLLPSAIKNHHLLLSSTEWVKPQLFWMLRGMSSMAHFCVTEFTYNDNNLFIRW